MKIRPAIGLIVILVLAIICTACQSETPTVQTVEVVNSNFQPMRMVSPQNSSLPIIQTTQGYTFYITCNNTLSDAARINSVIASSPQGAEIIIGGQCLVDQTIRLLGNRAYRGESRGTILKQADGANLAALLASETFLDNTDYTGEPVSVRHITLDGNKAKNMQVGTAGIILRSWLSVVENVHITNMRGDGLRITSVSANGTGLVTSQVNGRISGNFITGSGRHGIFVEDPQNAVTDWTLTDNWIAESAVDGIHLDNAAGWMITRNHIYGVPQNAIYAHRLFGTTISNNYIEGFGETAQAGTWHGIYATVQGNAASTIMGNRVFNFNLDDSEHNSASIYRYISLLTNYDTGVVNVMGNTIRGTGIDHETALHYTTTSDTQLTVTSIGNAIENIELKYFVDDGVTISSGY